MFQNHQAEWLLQSAPTIDEARWQQVTQLLCQLFKASAAALVQYQSDEACILTLRQTKNVGLVKGSIENTENLRARLRNPNLPADGLWQYGLIELPLYWPGGLQFGAVLLVCDVQPPNLESCQRLANPMLDLIQLELTVYRQAKQIEQMSLQDETTLMLNQNGFNLMVPRQLNLSRRLGSHAGVVVMESGVQFEGSIAEDKIKALSLVVYDNLREADIAARLDNQLVLLVFVDGQANLDSLVARLHKQFGRTLEEQRVLIGCSFFRPDSHLELGPMLANARADLEHYRARLYPNNNPTLKPDLVAIPNDNLKAVKKTADLPLITVEPIDSHTQSHSQNDEISEDLAQQTEAKSTTKKSSAKAPKTKIASAQKVAEAAHAATNKASKTNTKTKANAEESKAAKAKTTAAKAKTTTRSTAKDSTKPTRARRTKTQPPE